MSIREISLLISGCARSGTKWMAAVLQGLGIDIEHETIGKNGIASWYMVSPNMPLGVLYLGYPLKSDTIVLHQVREPLSCISSINRVFREDAIDYASEQLCTQLPEIVDANSRLEWVMAYWLYWNRLVEENAVWRYQIEDVTEKSFFKIFCDKIGIPYENTYTAEKYMYKRCRNLKCATDIGDYIKTPITWPVLFDINKELAQGIIITRKRYGYTL